MTGFSGVSGGQVPVEAAVPAWRGVVAATECPAAAVAAAVTAGV